MLKDKKFSGDFVFINDEESLFATVSRNSVYVYSFETKNTILKVKTLSNAVYAAISPDRNLLAVKNTSGTLALIDMVSGEEVCRDVMERTEGEPMFFTSSGKYVIDLDWGGRTILFDCNLKSHSILDNTRPLIRCEYIQYDRFTRKIYRFMAKDFGNSPGIIQTTTLDENHLTPEYVAYDTVQHFDKELPDHMHGLSFCSVHNYWYDFKNGKIVQFDKNFNKIDSINLPKINTVTKAQKIWVSPNENYLFIEYGRQSDVFKETVSEMKLAPSLSVLYDMKTMCVVKEFSYDYVSSFTMCNDDRCYIIGTWNGTFLGEIK